MSFQDAVKICFNKYVDFNGRARRSEFWWWVLFTFLLGIVASIIDTVLGTRNSTGSGLIQSVANLAVLLPSLAVGARTTARHRAIRLVAAAVVGVHRRLDLPDHLVVPGQPSRQQVRRLAEVRRRPGAVGPYGGPPPPPPGPYGEPPTGNPPPNPYEDPPA